MATINRFVQKPLVIIFILLFHLSIAFASDKQSEITSSKPKSYTIPIVDLAPQKHRQVIVDKEVGQYLGHPTTVLLEDNKTLIVVYPKGHGRGAIVMKRSTGCG